MDYGWADKHCADRGVKLSARRTRTPVAILGTSSHVSTTEPHAVTGVGWVETANGGRMRIILTLFLLVLAVAVPAGAVSIPEPPSPVPTPFTFYCSRCDPGPSRDRAGQ